MIHAMRLRRRPMPEPEFWELIGLLGGSTDDAAVGRLTEALRARGRRAAFGFAERLAEILYELDREVLARQPVRWSDDPDDVTIPLSADSFLYLRANIVAQGRAVVDQVLADPATLLRRRWDDGESLLYAADEAIGADIETRFDYETGSNEEYWSPVEDDGSEHEMPIVVVMLFDLLHPIEAYLDEAMTQPVVEYPPPLWLAEGVWDATGPLDAMVREAGGLPASLGAEQLQVHLGLGESWQLTPEVRGNVTDDFGVGQVVRVHAGMVQARFRAWPVPDQKAALLSLAATCCLAALPGDHGSRAALLEAAAAGAHLLPPPG